MQTQVRPSRTRSSGGRTLMLLGLVLALAAAAIVFYITTSVQGTFTQTVQLVAAKTTLKSGTILSLTNSTAPYMLVTDAFQVEKVDKSIMPPDAFIFTDQNSLNAELNDKIVVEQFMQGDFLRTNDPRVALVGQASGTSITNINPGGFKNGQGLALLGGSNAIGMQQGDEIDIIATGPVPDPKTGQTVIVTQTTLTKVPVYAVDVPAKGDVIVVLSNQDVLYLQQMLAGGFTLTYVIRKPGDPTDPSGTNPQGGDSGNDQPTTPVDDNSILKHFGITIPQ